MCYFPPPIERLNTLRNMRSPSAIELFMVTAPLYQGPRNACDVAETPDRNWTGYHLIGPKELAAILLAAHWFCGGQLDVTVLPAIS